MNDRHEESQSNQCCAEDDDDGGDGGDGDVLILPRLTMLTKWMGPDNALFTPAIWNWTSNSAGVKEFTAPTHREHRRTSSFDRTMDREWYANALAPIYWGFSMYSIYSCSICGNMRYFGWSYYSDFIGRSSFTFSIVLIEWRTLSSLTFLLATVITSKSALALATVSPQTSTFMWTRTPAQLYRFYSWHTHPPFILIRSDRGSDWGRDEEMIAVSHGMRACTAYSFIYRMLIKVPQTLEIRANQ